MRILKIFLVVITICLLGWAGYFFFIKKPTNTVIPTAPNTIVKEIEDKINKLGQSPKTEFCEKKYRSIKNDIDAYAKAKKFDNVLEESLLKRLDYTYTPLFVSQANYVFGGTDWELNKISIIRSEVNMLAISKNIENKIDLNKIKDILAKYDQITSFISDAKVFSNNYFVDSYNQTFDIEKTKDYIIKSSDFKISGGLVNNCDRIQAALQDIPNWMYSKHYNYLKRKVEFCRGKYKTMSNYNEFWESINLPVRAEFQKFEESYSIYSVPYTKPGNDLSSLKAEMTDENTAAKSFKYL